MKYNSTNTIFNINYLPNLNYRKWKIFGPIQKNKFLFFGMENDEQHFWTNMIVYSTPYVTIYSLE